MRKLGTFLCLCAAVFLFSSLVGESKEHEAAEWHMNATAIEACSCVMFCQCYFNTTPSGAHAKHGEDHFCRFNMAYKVNKGNHGSTDLTGAKFWIAGDLGGDFTKGMDWAHVYFDKSVAANQREALAAILGHLFPVKWKSFEASEGTLDKWEMNNDMAVATLDGGKTAEIRLKRYQGNTNDPIVIHNLKYWGAPRNDGFVLMPNEINAYRAGEKAFEFKGTNGFLITVDISSKDQAPTKASM